MLSSSHHWRAWLKSVLLNLKTSDWLTLLILLVVWWIASQVVSVVNPEPTFVIKFFQFSLTGAVVIGYYYRPTTNQNQLSLVSRSSIWLTTAKASRLSTLLIGLPLAVVVSALLDTAIWSGVLSALLIVISLTVIGTLGSQLPNKWGIPLFLATVWWLLFGSNQISGNLVLGILADNTGTQLILLMIAIGLAGVTASIVELTKPWQQQLEPLNFIKYWTFIRPMPSFTGMGSLLIVSLLRIVRDKVILIYTGSFLALLMSRILIVDWPIYWLVISGVGLAGLSILTVSRLIRFATSFSQQYSHLPLRPGQIEFVGFFAGLILMAAISWIIIWGLFGVTTETMARLIIAILSSYGVGFLVNLAEKSIEYDGFFDGTWRLIGQLLLFSLIFICSLQLPISGATFSLLVIIFLTVIITCYQVMRTWATIKL